MFNIPKISPNKICLLFQFSVNFDGSDRRVIVEGTLPHPFALSLFDDILYWTDWQTRAIHSCDKLTGASRRIVHENIFSPMDIHVYHPRRQPNGEYHMLKYNVRVRSHWQMCKRFFALMFCVTTMNSSIEVNAAPIVCDFAVAITIVRCEWTLRKHAPF